MSRKRTLSELDEPCTSAELYGAITAISPIKKGRNSDFFDATLADTTSKVRLVGFTPQQQIQLKNLHVAKSPVKITNCQVKPSRQGQGYDVLLKAQTHISKSPMQLDVDSIMSKVVTLDAIDTLPQYDKVSVNVKVLKLHEPEEVGADKKTKRDVVIADQTASTKVVLWEDQIDVLEEGQCYNLQHFYVKEFKAKKYLSMPKHGYVISSIDKIESTKTCTTEDEHTTIENATVIGVPQLDYYKSCLHCKARVEPMTPPLGKCTKYDCQMTQLYDLCRDQVSAKVFLRYDQDEQIILSAFGNMVNELANTKNTVTMADLFHNKPIPLVEFLTQQRIVTRVSQE